MPVSEDLCPLFWWLGIAACLIFGVPYQNDPGEGCRLSSRDRQDPRIRLIQSVAFWYFWLELSLCPGTVNQLINQESMLGKHIDAKSGFRKPSDFIRKPCPFRVPRPSGSQQNSRQFPSSNPGSSYLYHLPTAGVNMYKITPNQCINHYKSSLSQYIHQNSVKKKHIYFRHII